MTGRPVPRDLPCQHPGQITVTGRPGLTECVTCGALIHPDGTEEPKP